MTRMCVFSKPNIAERLWEIYYFVQGCGGFLCTNRVHCLLEDIFKSWYMYHQFYSNIFQVICTKIVCLHYLHQG